MTVTASPFHWTLRRGAIALPVSYALNIVANFRFAAGYVDRIPRGADPAQLPVEQSDTIELVVNLTTAKALGIKIPQSALVRADEVIK